MYFIQNATIGLASKSPRRIELLKLLGINFDIITNNNDATVRQHILNNNYFNQNLNRTVPYQVKQIMSTLHENFNRHWTHSKSTSPKLTFYHHVKKNFKCEVYLHDVKRVTDRAALTQLRISAHDLNIETGRYLQQSREERLCEWCHLVTSSNNISSTSPAITPP